MFSIQKCECSSQILLSNFAGWFITAEPGSYGDMMKCDVPTLLEKT